MPDVDRLDGTISGAALYLPISETTLERVLDRARSLGSVLRELSAHETAALLLLQSLPTRGVARAWALERDLANAIRAGGLPTRETGASLLHEHASSVLDRQTIDSGWQRLAELRIDLLDEEIIARRDFLSADGQWDMRFVERHRQRLEATLIRQRGGPARGALLTHEQSRLYAELDAQRDEHLHIQGYAGTGKSALIASLVRMLEPGGTRILVLADTQRQLDATPIDARGRSHVVKSTFAALARRLIPEDLTSHAYRNMLRMERSRIELPDDELVTFMGVRASGPVSARNIVRAARATLFVFCRSADAELDERHLPLAWRRTLDPVTTAVVCRHARALWDAIVSRSAKDLAPLIRGHHLIKWAALNRWPVPDTYTHVIVDESHYLPGAVRQILASGRQAVWTLGDDYQNLSGRAPPPLSSTRTREMTRSVRSDKDVERLVNPIIAAHPSGTKAPFHGNRRHRVEIIGYEASRAPVPESPATILVDDIWGLFEWVQRIASVGGDVSLMSERQDLDRFVKDCIELKTHETRARHLALVRFASWTEVSEHHHDNSGFRRIDRLLARGYGYSDWRRTYASLSRRDPDHVLHTVGLIGNALNREFDTVMLTPGALGNEQSRRRAAFGSAMYVTLTRARRRLIIPETLRQWIEELSARDGGGGRGAFNDDRQHDAPASVDTLE